MFIVIANTKGGSGKSTVSINLAGYAATSGKPTNLIDTDLQGTITDWHTVRGEIGLDPIPGLAIKYPPAHLVRVSNKATKKQIDEIINWVTNAAKAAPVVIMDVGGFDNIWIRAAMLKADKVVIPISPDAPNLWAAAKTVEMWIHAQVAGAKGKGFLLLNRAAATGSRNDEARQAMTEDWPNMPILKAQLVDRVAFRDSCGLGRFALETSDDKAKSELIALGKELIG